MKKSIISLFLIFCISFAGLLAQDYPVPPQTENLYKGNNTHDYNDVSGVNVIKPKSQEQINLENEIMTIKKSGDESKRDLLLQMNKRLGELSGDFTDQTALPYNGVLLPGNNEPVNGDNFQNTRIYNSSNSIKGLGTATEYVGTTAGRIWTVFFVSGNASTPDSLRVVYSTNNGLSWVTYATGYLGGTDKINYDDLDVEIIEPTTGNKYLWVVYGLRATGGTGRWFAGGLVLNISSFAGSFFAFSWPGNDPAKRYYNVRFTSDNGSYPTLAYLYIACSFDSLATNRINTQKYARILNPYGSGAPTVSYQGQKFWWFSSASGTQNRTLYTDIAFFQNGSDSVIVSFSGVPDSTKIFFSKASINGTASTGGGATSTGGTGYPTAYKTWARLSSNQNGNGSIICVFRVNAGGNWNVRYFRTTNFGNFTSFGESINWGSSVNANYQPDIIGRRNSNMHYFSFMTLSSSDSVHYVSVNSTGSTTHRYKMNAIALTSGTQGPKPGFRNVSGDSCFVVYTESGPVNVWASGGCSGTLTGIGNNNVPADYSISQNYPNPFNPTTSISYSLPKAGLVKIVVYDLLGKEVAALVNEVKQAGNYVVDFNASNLSSGVYFYKITSSNFSDIKKMMLLK